MRMMNENDEYHFIFQFKYCIHRATNMAKILQIYWSCQVSWKSTHNPFDKSSHKTGMKTIHTYCTIHRTTDTCSSDSKHNWLWACLHTHTHTHTHTHIVTHLSTIHTLPILCGVVERINVSTQQSRGGGLLAAWQGGRYWVPGPWSQWRRRTLRGGEGERTEARRQRDKRVGEKKKMMAKSLERESNDEKGMRQGRQRS